MDVLWKTSDYDKFATRNLSCTAHPDHTIKIISWSLPSPNTDPFPCHLASLVCEILATRLRLHTRADYLTSLCCRVITDSLPLTDGKLQFSQRWRQTHTYSTCVSTRAEDNSVYYWVKSVQSVFVWESGLVKLFIVQIHVWLNRYNSVRRLSRKSCKLILWAFSHTRSWGSWM